MFPAITCSSSLWSLTSLPLAPLIHLGFKLGHSNFEFFVTKTLIDAKWLCHKPVAWVTIKLIYLGQLLLN